MQESGVQPVRRSGQADHLHLGVKPGQVRQKAPVHGVARARNQVRLVNEHQVTLLDVIDPLVDRLDASKKDPGMDVTLLETGRIDARRGLWPELLELGVVLLDQLPHMGHDQDALVRIGLEHALDESGHHQ